MYIHKKGYSVIATVVLVAAIIIAAFWLFVPVELLQIFMTVAFSAIVFWSFTFFRVPTNRVTTIEENAVVSAADGEVVVIEEVEEESIVKLIEKMLVNIILTGCNGGLC